MTGFEPLITAAAAGLGGLITNLVKDKGTETLKKLDWDIGKNLALRKALVDYVRRYIDRHGTLKVACVRMDYPVRLDEIYTAVQLLDRWQASQYFADEAALQDQYRERGRRGLNITDTKKKPGLEVANEQQYLMVLGGPGVGKSTFLRKVGLEALKSLNPRIFPPPPPPSLPTLSQATLGNQSVAWSGVSITSYRHRRIPVMLELRQFDRPDRSIKAAIAKELDNCGFPAAEELTKLFLGNGKLLVLLDGLDEVPSTNLNHAITEIENLVDRYSDNRYIASCRVAAYTFGGFKRFKDVAMAAFEDGQIQQFIRNWFQKERDIEINTAKRCWALLNRRGYRAAKELAQTPLLLTLLCVVYDEYQDFPKKRHDLYGEALDVLLRKWASEKRIQRNPIYRELSTKLELDMLAEIAYTSFVDDQLFFSKGRLIHQIREFLMENLNAPNHLDAETVLKEIEIQQGILVERARDAYSFSHLTFQEYLTAKFIMDNHKINQMVRDHATEQHWREVFLLVAGLSPGRSGADALLLAMERQAQTYLASPKLKSLFAWSTAATKDSSGNGKAAAKRTAAVFLALDLAPDFSFGCDYARNLVFALDRALDRALTVERALDRALDLARILAFNLDHNRSRFRSHYLARARACSRIIFWEYQNLGIFREDLVNKLLMTLSQSKRVVPSKNSSFNRSREFVDKVILCSSENLGINLEKLSFSFEENRCMDNYFYILELMIHCKEAAVWVSPQVWAGIESRMVTVPTE
ncbi:NACHT domain-containing protein [Nodosilinea sp. PGN35]|uniref:NACHT domain-containing protein n=1 Tax=Nodosilinea sp. PGN35 TaxID=3020489 RepID=UPI0023B3154D|nr:NACHT domain-containing protein [Nodosilinea sp. TSF1-S3]MDF0369998.1 NACHT domain-containing protein [Nodosilinea sp. TSF1-S3]